LGPVLLDTHAWAWSLGQDDLLSQPARAALASADAVLVSPISFFEIGQKVRLGKWPEMEPFVPRLAEILREQGGMVAPLTPEICLDASLSEWSHRDPFDRLLAATCRRMEIPLVTRDAVFAGMGVHCIW
jgi:PIN domain nuclease of toxin-antitoxin system